jgi:2-iminobutanoate/2-iminopropanoate deaminase
LKKKITTTDAPAAAHILSQALVSNGFIFVSGQVHVKPDGSLVEGGTTDKVHQIMSNISAILKAADVSLDNIVKVIIYVTDLSVMPELNDVYPSYFKEPFPAREAVCVKELPLGANIEISVIATK